MLGLVAGTAVMRLGGAARAQTAGLTNEALGDAPDPARGRMSSGHLLLGIQASYATLRFTITGAALPGRRALIRRENAMMAAIAVKPASARSTVWKLPPFSRI